MMSVAKQTLSRVDGDFYHISTMLSEEDQALLHKTRTFMETEVAPIINHYWTREEFPYQILPGLAALGTVGLPYHEYGCPGKSTLLDGLMMMELARVDCSIATFIGVHSGLAMGSEGRGAWRCLSVEKLSRVELLEGAWHTALNHSRPQTCVAEVDVDAED